MDVSAWMREQIKARLGYLSLKSKMTANDPKREHRMCEYELQQGSCFRFNNSFTKMTAYDPKRTLTNNIFIILFNEYLLFVAI